MPEIPSGTDHTRVASVRGPAWCCKECSLRVGEYVEWPCPQRLLTFFALLARVHQALNGGDSAGR